MSESNESEEKVLKFPKNKKLAEILDTVYDAKEIDELDTSLFFDDEQIVAMNDKHAFIENYYGRSVVLCFDKDPVFGGPMLTFREPASIMMQYSNQTARIEDKVMELGKYWIKHSGRRQYKSVFFDPDKEKEHDGCYNIWTGLRIPPKKGSWKLTRKHIWKIICNSDPVKFKYFIKWLAWAVQNPGSPAETVMIIKGKQGAGKGFIFTQLCEIFGAHAMAISNPKQLAGQFNGHLERTCFLFADEAYNPGDREMESTLKQLITEKKITIEGKYKEPRTCKNCLHIVMATNEDWVIPVDSDSRRFYVNEVENTYAKGHTTEANRSRYFRALWGEMANGGREAMLHDLLAIDLTGWHPREHVPGTKEMEHQKFLSATKAEKAFLLLIEEGMFPGFFVENRYEVRGVDLSEHLKGIYPEFHRVSTMQWAKICAEMGVKKYRTQKSNVWEFPELSELRERWLENKFKYDFDTNTRWQLKSANF